MSTSVFSSPSQTADSNQQKDGNVQQAVELTKKIATSDKSNKDKTFNDFKILVSKNPENNIIRNMYANTLIAERYYKEGLSNIKILNEKNLTRTNLLTQCMLQERLGNRDENCYKQVISISEKSNIIDSDYISALFFAEHDRFEILKSKLIKENKFNENDFLVFTLGKEKMLYEFYP